MEKKSKAISAQPERSRGVMPKKLKVCIIVFLSVFAAVFAANIITEIFKTKLNKYYSVT